MILNHPATHFNSNQRRYRSSSRDYERSRTRNWESNHRCHRDNRYERSLRRSSPRKSIGSNRSRSHSAEYFWPHQQKKGLIKNSWVKKELWLKEKGQPGNNTTYKSNHRFGNNLLRNLKYLNCNRIRLLVRYSQSFRWSKAAWTVLWSISTVSKQLSSSRHPIPNQENPATPRQATTDRPTVYTVKTLKT